MYGESYDRADIVKEISTFCHRFRDWQSAQRRWTNVEFDLSLCIYTCIRQTDNFLNGTDSNAIDASEIKGMLKILQKVHTTRPD